MPIMPQRGLGKCTESFLLVFSCITNYAYYLSTLLGENTSA